MAKQNLTNRSRLAGFAAALLVSACDPAYRYRPMDWRAVESRAATWSFTANDIDLETGGLGGLIGSRDISPEFDIRNRSDRLFVLDRAELVTGTVRHLGQLPDRGALDGRTVSPASTDRISISWSFAEPAVDVLGPRPRVVLEFRLGDEPDRLDIAYERIP